MVACDIGSSLSLSVSDARVGADSAPHLHEAQSEEGSAHRGREWNREAPAEQKTLVPGAAAPYYPLRRPLRRRMPHAGRAAASPPKRESTEHLNAREFVQELSRRKVVRAAIFYAVVAWVLIQPQLMQNTTQIVAVREPVEEPVLTEPEYREQRSGVHFILGAHIELDHSSMAGIRHRACTYLVPVRSLPSFLGSSRSHCTAHPAFCQPIPL